MSEAIKKTKRQTARIKRTRAHVHATADRPKLLVTRSNRYIYAQVIDTTGKVLAAASSLKMGVGNSAVAAKVGETVATKAVAAGVTKVAFDRSGNSYHGNIKALADAAREHGLPVVRHVVRPDVVLGPLGEPGVLVRGVVRDEIDPELDAVRTRLGDEGVVVGERAVVGVDLAVVRDVVAPVDVRARVDRAQPERVDSERREVREMRPHAAERAEVELIDGQLIVQLSPDDTSACRSPPR